MQADEKFGYKAIDEVELNYDNLDDDLKIEGYINKNQKIRKIKGGGSFLFYQFNIYYD